MINYQMPRVPETSVCSRSLASESLVSQIQLVCINFIKIHNQTMMKLTYEASARLLLGPALHQ